MPSGADRDDPGGTAKLLKGGRYELVGTLGGGAQAETFEAIDHEGGARVAIKRFNVRGAKSWKDVELAEREARVLAELSHPSLPKYLDHFEEDGALYLVMEKVEGTTLGALAKRRALDQATVARFLTEMGHTLEYLHGLSPPIIHRDIKPGNVIVRPDGSFALVDFGSVRDNLRPEGGSTVVGTFGYMAPEQFQGRALPGTDVYGAGATALACLTGSDPEHLPHRGLALDVRAALGNQLDEAWVTLLSRLLEPNPDLRPRSLTAALAALHPSGRPRAPSVPPTTEASGRDERRQRRRQEKRERREERRAYRRQRHGFAGGRAGVSGPILLVVMVALLVARLATFALFRVALPIVLGVLAQFFGGRLRAAADRCHEIGELGEVALRRALERVREVPYSGPESPLPRARVRIFDPDFDPDERHAVDDDAQAPASRRARHEG